MRFIVTVIGLILLGSLLVRKNASLNKILSGASLPSLAASPVSAETAFSPQLMLDQVNAVRARGCKCPDGLFYQPAPALKWNDRLAIAAKAHANDMADQDYFSHVSKDGANFTDRVSRAGYDWQTVAENIAYGHRDTREVVQAWVHSNGHCQNIMNPHFLELGAAKVGSYWVQELGARP
jgi:uncharacterized protein YkwD